jgi:hypothetical protein
VLRLEVNKQCLPEGSKLLEFGKAGRMEVLTENEHGQGSAAAVRDQLEESRAE